MSGTSLYLPKDLRDRLDQLARASGRSRSNAARRLLESALGLPAQHIGQRADEAGPNKGLSFPPNRTGQRGAK